MLRDKQLKQESLSRCMGRVYRWVGEGEEGRSGCVGLRSKGWADRRGGAKADGRGGG